MHRLKFAMPILLAGALVLLGASCGQTTTENSNTNTAVENENQNTSAAVNTNTANENTNTIVNTSTVNENTNQVVSDITLGAVENDLTELETIQDSVDNGSQPWRLDPLAVATAEGVTLGFDQANDEFVLASQVETGEYSGTGEATVEAVHDGVTYEIQLIQPVDQGDAGIWAINSVSKK